MCDGARRDELIAATSTPSRVSCVRVAGTALIFCNRQNISPKHHKITPVHHGVAPGLHDVAPIEGLSDTDDDEFSFRRPLLTFALESGHF